LGWEEKGITKKNAKKKADKESSDWFSELSKGDGYYMTHKPNNQRVMYRKIGGTHYTRSKACPFVEEKNSEQKGTVHHEFAAPVECPWLAQ
jgi:nitrite reductase/ring-hydroxylating ferredoxin subunit